MGPSMTHGADIRSQRSAAMNVIVFQWPKGADAASRCPHGPQPRSGAMLVLIQVSSIKTRREASILPWWVFQRTRLRATSGRSCSAARIVFFKAQAFGMNEGPHSPHIGFDAAFGQLGGQLAQGEGAGANAPVQPFSMGTRQRPLFV